MHKALAFAAETTVWWAASLGVWLLTLSSVNTPDLAVAVPVSLLCGAAAVPVRRTVGVALRPSPRVVRWLPPYPLALLTDTAAMLLRPWQVILGLRDEGRIVRIPVAAGPAAQARATRAAAAMLVSSTPGSMVLDIDEDAGELVVHLMVDGRFGMQRAVQR